MTPHVPFTEEELAELELAASVPWFAAGSFVMAGTHETNIEAIAQAYSEDMVETILAIPRLVAEVRHLRSSEGESCGYSAEAGHCDGVAPAPGCQHPHRCFKDGRWLDDGSEM